jgi:hypothetical protein
VVTDPQPPSPKVGGGAAVLHRGGPFVLGKDKEVLECSGRRLLSAPQPKKVGGGVAADHNRGGPFTNGTAPR